MKSGAGASRACVLDGDLVSWWDGRLWADNLYTLRGSGTEARRPGRRRGAQRLAEPPMQ